MGAAHLAVLVASIALTLTGVVGVVTHDSGGDHHSVAVVAKPIGKAFHDTRGNYTIQVDPKWPHREGFPIEGISSWQVAEPLNGFAPNINVTTERLPNDDVSVRQYLDATLTNLPKFAADAKLVDHKLVSGVFGQTLGVIEWEGTGGGQVLHFLQVFSVHARHAVVVTFTVLPGRFAELRSTVEPYLLTLQAT